VKKNIPIIGCGGAGMFSAIVATQLKKEAFKATILSNEKDIYCRCSTPYILTKRAELKDAIQPDSMIEDFGVKLVAEQAEKIDFRRREVTGAKGTIFPFDYLVIATGASPIKPPIKGLDSINVHTVRTSDDVDNIKKLAKRNKKAVVIGGGVIGVEMTGALRELGVKITLVELKEQLLAGVTDIEYSDKIKELLEKKKTDVILESMVEEIKTKRNKTKTVIIKTKNDKKKIDADFVIVAAGVKPNTKIAEEAGVKTDRGYIIVDSKMRTNKPGVYACGDCTTSQNAINKEYWPSQLASVAIQQAKIVGYQIAGFPIKYHGHTDAFAFQTLGKEFSQVGFDEEKAREKYRIVFVGRAKTTDIYNDMKDKEDLDVKLIFAGLRLKLVGAQAYGKGVIGHMETASLAISLKTSILKLLRYNYIAHPSLTPWPFMNPIIMACEDAMGKVMKRLRREK